MRDKLNKLYLKLKEWLLPILLAIGGILDFTIELLPYAVSFLNVDQKWVNIIRFSMVLVTAIVAKMNNNRVVAKHIIEKANDIEVYDEIEVK